MSAFHPLRTYADACTLVQANGKTSSVDEQKVLITPDGFGRIAIVRRPDGMFCLYEHWRWSADTQAAMRVEPVVDRRWSDGDYDRDALYEDVDPLPGLFGSIEEAEREARGREAFSDAIVEKSL